jgi:hypothetical protein
MDDAMDDMLKDFVVEALELAVDVEEKLLQLERFRMTPRRSMLSSGPSIRSRAAPAS